MSGPYCTKCGEECDVIIVDDSCINAAGACMGYQPTHGESWCCRAGLMLLPFNKDDITMTVEIYE